MSSFLIYWSVMAVSLGLAVGGLHLIYRAFGSELGLKGLRGEIVTVLVCSGLQAGVPWVVQAACGFVPIYLWALNALIAFFVYRLTHVMEMTNLEAGAIPFVQLVVLAALSFLLIASIAGGG